MSKKALSKIFQEGKKLNIPCRNCIKTKQEPKKTIAETQSKYKDIIFVNDTPICRELKACILTGLCFHKNIVLDYERMLDRRTGEVLSPEVDYTCYKDKLQVNFIVPIDHKITCCREKLLHTLCGIGTLDT